MSGRFIVLEGADGAGTTTISKYLRDEISTKYGKNSCVLTREPSDYAIGKFIRRVLRGQLDVESGSAMFHLFVADRYEHIKKTIIPALELGKIVISDRYFPSTIVYQSVKKNDPVGSMNNLNALLTLHKMTFSSFVTPDLVLYLQCPPDVLKKRRVKRGGEEEKYESSEYQKLVAELYEFYFCCDRGFCHKKINASNELEIVKRDSRDALSKFKIFS